jgi:DNA-binding transcriptional LysR family regulator
LDAVLPAALQGLGLALLPSSVGAADGLERLNTNAFDFGDALWLLSHPDLLKAERISQFMQFCRNHAKEYME